MSFTTASINIQQDLLNAMHAQVEVPWTVVVRNSHQPSTSSGATATSLHEKPQCYFVIIENVQDGDLEDVFEDWKTDINWNPLAQFVVFMASIEETEEEMTELMIDILLSFMNKNIYNVNVIGRNQENGCFYGKTVFPYHPDNNCGNRVIAIETLDICNCYGKDMFDDDGDYDNVESDGDEDEVNKNSDCGQDVNESVEGNNSEKIYQKRESVEDGDENANRDLLDQTIEGKRSRKDYKGIVNEEKVEDNGKKPERKKSEIGREGENDVVSESEFQNNRGDENEEGAKSEDIAEDEKNGTDEKLAEDKEKGEGKEEEEGDTDNESESHKTEDVRATNELYKYAQEIYVQELYRGRFWDKFPEDLSGCVVAAAYRSWEPYIFKEDKEKGSSVNGYRTICGSNEESATDIDVYDAEENSGATEHKDDYAAANGDGYASSVSDTDTDAYAYDDVDTDGPTPKLNGIEYQLIQTIGELLNITIDLQVENSNLYMLFQQLIDGDIEIILGGIDEDPSLSHDVSSSIAYYQDDLTWCVAKAKRNYSLFNFLQTFHISTWIFTLVFIFSTSLNVFLTQKLLNIRLAHFDGFFATFMRIFGIILSQSTSLMRLPCSLCITFGSTFLLALIFINSYQSFLVSVLTTPQSAYQISHLDEIHRNRMAVTGSVENVRHLSKDGETFKYIRENFQMCYNIEECLNRAAADEHIAVAVSRQHSFYNPRILREQLYCFDRNENIYVYLVTLLFPKKYHLLHKINPIIQHVIESGHMQKWARELDLKRKIHEEMERAQKELVKGLSLNEVAGSFVLHGMLAALSGVVFLLEHWAHWMVLKRRTRLRFVKMLHRRFN